MASLVFPLLACSLLLTTPCRAELKLEIRERGEMSEGKAFSLTCLVAGGSYHKDDPIEWRKNYKILPGKTHPALVFAALDRSDTGMYDCGYNVSGTINYSRPFLLSFSYRPVVHISVRVNDFNDSSVPAGFDVYLTCNVTNSHPEVPEDGYRWWYAKTRQDTAGFLVQKNTSVLKLPSVRTTDEGCYSCMAVNQHPLHGNASKMLHVSYLELPCISVDPAVMEGDSTRVNCTVSSSPKATLELYKDGSLLRRGEGEGLLSHPISKVALQHQGTYECRASNDDISATKSVTTDFQIRHKPVASDNRSHCVPVEAPLGANVSLIVEFEANPPARVEWRQVSPQSLPLDAAVHSHNSSQLTVRLEAAEAVFCVKVSNQYGEFSRQFDVRGVAYKGRNAADSNETTTTKKEEGAGGFSAWSLGVGIGVGVVIGFVLCLPFVLVKQRCGPCRDTPPAGEQGGTPETPEAVPLRPTKT